MAVEGEIDVAISQSIMDETLRVMREKFQATPEQLDDARNIMESCTRKVYSLHLAYLFCSGYRLLACSLCSNDKTSSPAKLHVSIEI